MINGPQVSFITICYNGFKDTCELIESLQNKIHSVSYEIIVVDNASREMKRLRYKHYTPRSQLSTVMKTKVSPEATT